MDWSPENIAHYNRLFDDREKRRNEVRNLPVVITHYGERIEIPGWHEGVSVIRTVIPDDFRFGNSQRRVAPTNRKAR